MNKLVEKFAGSTSLTPAAREQIDPFEALARRDSTIDGELLRFKKGKWLEGEDKTSVPEGTHLVADMHQLWEGHTKWQDGHVVDRAMCLVEEGIISPPRQMLGDHDEGVWEIGPDGPKDPWVFGFSLALHYLDKPEAEQLIFNTSTWGGIKCMRKLIKTYARRGLARRDMLPVVELKAKPKPHPKYGEVIEPVLQIVDWIEDPEAPPTVSAQPVLEAAATTSAKMPPQTANADAVLDDSIPY